jgi:hypothetical protein
MINVFELREMGLDKILDPLGNDLNKVRESAVKENRTLMYQAQMSHLPSMTPMSLGEPSFRIRPSHWFNGTEGKHTDLKLLRGTPRAATASVARSRSRSVSLVSSVTF